VTLQFARSHSIRHVSDLFRTVVRWAAAVLIGVPAGGQAAAAGQASLAIAAGGLLLLLGGVFVAASILATNLTVASRIGRTPTPDDRGELGQLVGPALFRTVFLGLVGGGLLVGVLQPLGSVVALVAASSGVVALVLTLPSSRADTN
jgi:hypothetical protein